MAQRTCRADGCTAPANVPGSARGLCRRHYYRWKTYGDPNAEVKEAPRWAGVTCSVDGCDGPVLARGWCCVHYNRWANHGDPEGLAPRLQAIEQAHAAGMLRCNKCQRVLPPDQFGRDKTKLSGKRSTCRECTRKRQNERRAQDPEYWREYHRRRYAANPEPARRYAREYGLRHPDYRRAHRLATCYGLTLADRAAMEQQQGGRCLLCDEVPEKRLVVDHCHETGRVRGLLCDRCNTTLGFVEKRGLDRIADYLAPPEQSEEAAG